MISTRHLYWLHAAIVISLLLTATAQAGVTTRVDRPAVDLNESFTLQIIVDSNVDLEPDLSVLDEQFYVGSPSQLSNTSIINGQISRSRTWSVPMMAKVTGQLTIPSISVGNETSEPIRVTVNEATEAPPGEADVFVVSEIDQDETFVQAQILYRIKVYRAVATRQPALREPTIKGAEVLAELAGDERSYDATLNGRAYSVVERVIAIYPQESGEISISPARFEARVLRDGRITGRKVFESGAHTVTVLPIPAPPAEYPDAAWLPAKDVQLSEEWSREPNEVQAGEPVTRRVTISALGQIETQIPALDPPEIDGMNVYADKPELSRQLEAGGIRGVREDQYAMIGVRGGDLQIPEVKVPWWNIDAGEWRVATLPSRVVTVEGIEEPAAPPAAATVVADAEPPVEVPVEDRSTPFWKLATQILGGVWVLTLFAWWWSSREARHETREPAPPPIHKQQAKRVKTARKAASAGDKSAVRAELLEWAKLQWPSNPPRSVGELAARVASPLSDELRRLSALSYGSSATEWDGKALASALRSINVVSVEDAGSAQQSLPPLLPPGVTS